MLPDCRLAVTAVFLSSLVFDFWFNSLIGQQGLLYKHHPLSQEFLYSVIIRFNICCFCLLVATLIDAFYIILDVFLLNQVYCVSMFRYAL